MHWPADPHEARTTTHHIPAGCQHLSVGGQQTEEQSICIASQSDGLLRRPSVEHYHTRVHATRCFVQVPVYCLFLRNMEARVQNETD